MFRELVKFWRFGARWSESVFKEDVAATGAPVIIFTIYEGQVLRE